MPMRPPHRFALPVLTDRTFENPASFGPGVVPPTRPDPFVVRHRGRYYCFATGEDAVSLSVSDDLVSWRILPDALVHEGRHSYWAPCVAQIDGTFYLYYSSSVAGSDDPHDELLFVARSERIEGPYGDIRQLSTTFAIDPHVVCDDDGRWYMFYSTNEPTGLDEENAGTSILVDRLLSPVEPEGRPRPVVVPSVDVEVYEKNRFGSGRDWYTIEGGAFFTHGRNAYLTYSGNAFVRPDYFIGYATADRSRSIGELDWTKRSAVLEEGPLVARSDRVEGTGHNSIITAPNLVDHWIVYHGRDAAVPIDEAAEQRIMRIDPLFFSGDRVVTPAPSSSVQDAPARPTVSTRFDGPVLPDGWRVVQGTPLHRDGSVVAADSDRLLLALAHRSAAYVAEVAVRATRGHAGARFGVVPWLADDGDYVEVLYDAGTRSAITRRHRSGFVSTLETREVVGAAVDHWATLRIERTIDRVEVRLGQELLSSVGVDPAPALVGLVSIRTRTEFGHFALTDALALFGRDLASLGAVMTLTPEALVDEHGVTARSSHPLVLERAGLDDGLAVTCGYELLDLAGRIDVYPWYASEHDHVRVGVRAGSYTIEEVRDGVRTVRATGESPFLRHASVRVRRAADRLVVHVDAAVHELSDARRGPGRWRAEVAGGARLISYEEVSYAERRMDREAARSGAASMSHQEDH